MKYPRLSVYFSFIFLISGCSSIQIINSDQLISQAKLFNQQGDWKESNKHINLLEGHEYLTDELIVLKSKNFQNLAKFETAREVLDQALNSRPHSIVINEELAQLNFSLEEYEKSEEICEYILKRDSQSIKARIILAKIKIHRGNYLQAQTILEASSKLSLNSDALYLLGYVFFKQQKLKLAIRTFEKIKNDPKYEFQTARYLSWLYTENKNVIRANKYIQYLILQNPKDAFAQKMLTKNLLNIDGTDKISILRTYNQNFVNDWGKHQYWLALNNGGLEKEGVHFLSKLWNDDPGKSWVAISYARSLSNNGDKALAVNVLEKSRDEAVIEDRNHILTELALMDSKEMFKSRNIASGKFNYLKNVRNSYQIAKSDTLQSISFKFFNTTKRWKEIFELNKDKIKNTYKLEIGSWIQLPLEKK